MSSRAIVHAHGILAALLLCLAAGCSSDDGPGPVPHDDPYEARTSPQNLIANLKTAYLLREVVPYDSLLATDFEFLFSEEDQMIGEKLTRTEEMTVHQNMFSSDAVQSITLSFTNGELTQDTGEPDPANPGQFLWTLIMTNADLMLRVLWDGQTTTYEMQDGIEQFWFRQVPWTDSHGNPIWKIVKWRELTDLYPDGPARPMPVEGASWGQLKDLYR